MKRVMFSRPRGVGGPHSRAVVAAIVLAAFASAAAAQGPREIFDASGEGAQAGFADLDLDVVSVPCENWSHCTVQASGRFRGQRVALEVLIELHANGRGRIVYRSVGSDSDALLAAMATTYKRPLPHASFARSVTAELAALGVEDGKLDGKVFFAAGGPEADYAELYTNVDAKRRVLEIHEKDTSYRANVLKALSRP